MIGVLTQIAAGPDEAVRSLLLSRAAEAHRLATWILHDPVAAEDAVQSAALHAWERRRSLRDPAAAEAWFNRILVNECRAELRRRARQNRTRVEAAAWGAPIADRWADADELTRAIVRLDPEEQILVALRFGRDFTVPQIAETTGMREGTVKSRLHHALSHLRAELDAERRAGEIAR